MASERLILDFYKQKNYQFLAQRFKTPFAEIDLLFWSPEGHLVMVEVKTSTVGAFRSRRISWRQKERLQRSLMFLSSRFDCLVAIHWAFVTRWGKIDIVEDICG